jgi:hypothetical protein
MSSAAVARRVTPDEATLAAAQKEVRAQTDNRHTTSDESIKQEVANGWRLDERATPTTLAAEDRSRYALAPDETYAPVLRLQHVPPQVTRQVPDERWC